MSDYNDVLYDPRDHTHESCVKEIQSADMVILIIGSRFGGKAIPKAIENLDIETIKAASKSTSFIDKGNISITQLEILKAVELEIPIFTFIAGQKTNGDGETFIFTLWLIESNFFLAKKYRLTFYK